MTPHDKMCAVMSILQAHILAADSLLDPEEMFPLRHFKTDGLELAEKMLDELLPVLEGVERREKKLPDDVERGTIAPEEAPV